MGFRMELVESIFSQSLLVAAVVLLAYLARRYQQSQRSFKVPSLPKGYQAWPLPEPEVGFELTASKEPKFRPFRWGQYRLTMGIKPLNPLDWLILHSSYPSYARLRAARHATYGPRSFRVLPDAQHLNALAALESARAIGAYLACRYPALFSVEPAGAERSQGGWEVRRVRRRAAPGLEAAAWELPDLGANGEGGAGAMRAAGEMVPDDLALLRETDLTPQERAGYPSGKAPTRAHRFVAGSICTAGFWTLDDKLGLCLREIHTTGNVPDYDTKLRDPLDRFFSKLKPNKPVERIDNFFFQIADPRAVPKLLDGTLVPDILSSSSPEAIPISGGAAKDGEAELSDRSEISWSHTTNGPEKLFDQVTKGPKKQDEGMNFEAPRPTRDPDTINMRTERQTLRRLPRSGAVLFTIRTYIVPLTTMAQEPGVPGRLVAALRSWPPETREYKGGHLYFDCALEYLDRAHVAQVEQGLTSDDVEEESLRAARAFPF